MTTWRDQIGRVIKTNATDEIPFGGLAVMFFGDYLQLAKPASLAMYSGAEYEAADHKDGEADEG